MNTNYTCIIVDDEPKAVELLVEHLGALYKNIDIVGAYTTWDAALQALRDKGSDLLFMDISMPGKTGLELLGLIPNLACEVVFVTAHSEYAINAFRFAASGYVLKPIDDKDLAIAVDNALERINLKRVAGRSTLAPDNQKIGIPNSKGIDYVDINDIICLEAVNSCTRVMTNKIEIISSYTLGRFWAVLEKHQAFYQVQRSYVVNLNHVRRYNTKGMVVMANGCEIPVSKSIREDFLQKFERVSKAS